MIVAVAKEISTGERRVALIPDAVKQLKAKGVDVIVERGAGAGAGFDDAAYE
ncbi:MAG: NAD(P)(+) transhydrogenase (Re/Si-specific) subunit alpha, partial [Myxococcales bacterium]